MPENWTPRPADRVVRHPRMDELGPIRITVGPRRARSRFISTPFTIAYIFLGLIAAGTLLLLLPFTHHGGGALPFLTALFTATSAVTDTGLVVENTTEFWTFFGKVVILGLMYVGGLGFMTLATFGLIIIGQRVTMSQRLLAREFLVVNQLGGLVRLTVGVVVVATAIQLVGFVALFIRFNSIYPLPTAIWQAAFHSVSAFNSAGFNISREQGELAAFQRDPIVLGIMTILIFIGVISYPVIIDVFRIRRFSRYTLNTKLVLAVTALTVVVAVGGLFIAEYANPNTLGPLSVQEKFVGSVFQGVSNRTAGFNIFDYGKTSDGTQFLTTAFMFVGGASASVSGGIKVNTLAVILVAFLSSARGRSYPRAFGREVPWEQVQRAMVIGMMSAVFVFALALLLSITEDGLPFLDVFFETVSAFGTNGLSTGITGSLSTLGQLLITIAMFVGKLGPITIGLTMAHNAAAARYRYPQEGVFLG